nr:hypothetical protein [Microctonus hyperodae filamentous virus]
MVYASWILFIVIVVMYFCLYFSQMNDEEEKKIANTEINLNVRPFINDKVHLFDCNAGDSIACVSTSDCQNLCGTSFICRENTCRSTETATVAATIVGGGGDDDDNDCEDESKAIYRATFVYNDLFYKSRCVSLNRLLWQDNGQLAPGVCSGGMLNSDNNKCTCPANSVMGYFSNFHPSIPRCIPRHAQHLYTTFITVADD